MDGWAGCGQSGAVRRSIVRFFRWVLADTHARHFAAVAAARAHEKAPQPLGKRPAQRAETPRQSARVPPCGFIVRKIESLVLRR
jgi:hypothetical protein